MSKKKKKKKLIYFLNIKKKKKKKKTMNKISVLPRLKIKLSIFEEIIFLWLTSRFIKM